MFFWTSIFSNMIMKTTTIVLILFLTLFLCLSQANATGCFDSISPNEEEPMDSHINFQSDLTADYANSPSGPTLLDFLPQETTLTIFTDLIYRSVQYVELLENYDINPKVSLFAPTNSALKQYLSTNGPGRLIFNENDRLNKFIGRHLATGMIDIESLRNHQILEGIIEGDKINVTEKEGKILLNGQATVHMDRAVKGANGIIYFIDGVLE